MPLDPIVREFVDQLEDEQSRELLQEIEHVESEEEQISLIITAAIEFSRARAACDS